MIPGEANPVWLVIAAYNEGAVVADVVRHAKEHFPNIVLVDDGSKDDTAVHALAGGAHVLRHAVNLGQGAALQTGIDYALEQGAQTIVTFDADGQHRVEDVAEMISRLYAEKADIALGSRFLGSTIGMPRKKLLTLKGAILFTWLTAGLKLTDAHNGLRVLTRTAAKKIRIRQNRMAHASEIIELIRQHRLNYIEVPMTVVYTDYSKAKGQPIGNMLNIMVDLFMGRLNR